MAYCYIKVSDIDGNVIRRFGGNNRECRLSFDSFVTQYGLKYYVTLYKTSSGRIIRSHNPKIKKRKR